MSSLQPLTSDETRYIARKIIVALEVLPKHRHNKPEAREDCGTCTAKDSLILAFKTFKRVGE